VLSGLLCEELCTRARYALNITRVILIVAIKVVHTRKLQPNKTHSKLIPTRPDPQQTLNPKPYTLHPTPLPETHPRASQLAAAAPQHQSQDNRT
jgi:hypothetical protein